jgi:kynurenine formamidase
VSEIPVYSDLPVADGVHHSWGIWGPEDRLGTLNNITADAVLRGVRCARQGKVFSLNLDMATPGPPLFERPQIAHELVVTAGGALNDIISSWNPQNSSQWDGFRHVSWPGHGNYNGKASEQHGVDHWSRHPIVTRAVLLDVARARAAWGVPVRPDRTDLIEAADLRRILREADIGVERGDVLLIRTGWLAWYLTQDSTARARMADRTSLVAPGLAGREEMVELLWDLGVAGVAADNPSLEAWPPGSHLSEEQRSIVRADPARRHEASLHIKLLPALGLPIGELWDLEALAQDCADDGRYTMCLTSAPINLVRGAATPANAIAVK